jgi:hypothetical protein
MAQQGHYRATFSVGDHRFGVSIDPSAGCPWPPWGNKLGLRNEFVTSSQPGLTTSPPKGMIGKECLVPPIPGTAVGTYISPGAS